MEKEYGGVLRITNLKTLQAWKDNGKYQKLINDGFIFAVGCGRFRVGKCGCSRCKKPNGGWEKKAVLELNGLLNDL